MLKIDRSFVRELPDQPEAGSMVTAIIQLAYGLGMEPLAEGIETREQWAFLAERGCPLGQGFHFSRPVTAREIVARGLRERRGRRASGGSLASSV